MGNSKRLSDKEILEDLSAMLKSTVDFDRTIGMMKLTEDELLIFKRAAHQLRKPQPNMLILRKAYDIFVVKSYANSATNYYDTQAILSENNTSRGIFSGFFDSAVFKLFLVVLVTLFILSYIK